MAFKSGAGDRGESRGEVVQLGGRGEHVAADAQAGDVRRMPDPGHCLHEHSVLDAEPALNRLGMGA